MEIVGGVGFAVGSSPINNFYKKKVLNDAFQSVLDIPEGSEIDHIFGVSEFKFDYVKPSFEKNVSLDERSLIVLDDVDLQFCSAKSLLESFKDKDDFDFAKFANFNDVPIASSCFQCTDVSRYNFQKMHEIVTQLLITGVYVDKTKQTITLSIHDIVSAYNNVCYVTDDIEMSYRFFGELGKVIYDKLLLIVDVLKERDMNIDIVFDAWIVNDIISNIFTLPLVNVSRGQELGIKIFELLKECDVLSLSDSNFRVLCSHDKLNNIHTELFTKFKKLGVFFIFRSEKLAYQIFDAAQILTAFGVQLPVFVVEFEHDSIRQVGGLSNTICGIALNKHLQEYTHEVRSNMPLVDTFEVPRAQKTFYHECIHHVRQAAGALSQASPWMPNIKVLFGEHHCIIESIIQQVSEYALTNREEYIAEFGAKVLCCLQTGRNPLNYITDSRLWRLYYEFGGPDFASMINDKFCKEDYDILVDYNREYSHLPGLPSKFEIDPTKLENKELVVSGLLGLHVLSKETLRSDTVMPPPPLGYCYIIDNGKLQLKIDKHQLPYSKDDKYYDPVFCRLTNGALILMETKPKIERHYEII